MEIDIKAPKPHILITLETEDTLADDLILASTNEIENFIVNSLLPRQWTKKDIPIAQQENIEFEKHKVPNDVDLAPHKLLELFVDDEVIENLCEQSKLCANNKEKIIFQVLQMSSVSSVLFLQYCLLSDIHCYQII